MNPPTAEEVLDALFSDRYEIVEQMNLHPSLRASFAPLPTCPLSAEQLAVHFPGQQSVVRQMIQTALRKEDV